LKAATLLALSLVSASALAGERRWAAASSCASGVRFAFEADAGPAYSYRTAVSSFSDEHDLGASFSLAAVVCMGRFEGALRFSFSAGGNVSGSTLAHGTTALVLSVGPEVRIVLHRNVRLGLTPLIGGYLQFGNYGDSSQDAAQIRLVEHRWLLGGDLDAYFTVARGATVEGYLAIRVGYAYAFAQESAPAFDAAHVMAGVGVRVY
jgi:hypothetical protein